MASLKQDYLGHPREYAREDHMECDQEVPSHDCRCFISPPCNACVGCPAHDEDAWED